MEFPNSSSSASNGSGSGSNGGGNGVAHGGSGDPAADAAAIEAIARQTCWRDEGHQAAFLATAGESLVQAPGDDARVAARVAAGFAAAQEAAREAARTRRCTVHYTIRAPLSPGGRRTTARSTSRGSGRTASLPMRQRRTTIPRKTRHRCCRP